MNVVVLAHDVVADTAARRTAVFLHGILGSRGNWRSFCKRVVTADAATRCALLDLRGHGASHGLSPPHTIAACADDVLALGLTPEVVVGHSFGGKVALEIARRAPPGVRDVVVLDVSPGGRTMRGQSEIERVLATVRAVPMPIASRRALVDELRARGLSEPVALWMTTNLAPSGAHRGATSADGPLSWVFDLSVIDELLVSFCGNDYWPFLEGHQGTPRVHFVRAGKGARFTDDDVARLEALARARRVSHRVLEGAGHWLHTDDPEGLARLLVPILAGQTP